MLASPRIRIGKRKRLRYSLDLCEYSVIAED